jgi:hypothetical protein
MDYWPRMNYHAINYSGPMINPQTTWERDIAAPTFFMLFSLFLLLLLVAGANGPLIANIVLALILVPIQIYFLSYILYQLNKTQESFPVENSILVPKLEHLLETHGYSVIINNKDKGRKVFLKQFQMNYVIDISRGYDEVRIYITEVKALDYRTTSARKIKWSRLYIGPISKKNRLIINEVQILIAQEFETSDSLSV